MEVQGLDWCELLPRFFPMTELHAQKADFCLQLYFQKLHVTIGIQNSEII